MNRFFYASVRRALGVSGLFTLLGFAANCCFSSPAPPVPGKTWLQYAAPGEAGWSATKLAEARRYSESIGSASVFVVYDGAVLAAWGDYQRRFWCHSIRKSFLSALYGIAVTEGSIDLQKTLADLRIDDRPPLSDREKTAKIRDLLQARSGIYLPAAYEGAVVKPPRDQFAPGSHWLYNNWDFNVLGTIYEKETHAGIFDRFKERIADPLQMEDYRVRDGYYHFEPDQSIYPAYPFRMSARDMARFGLLFLRNGRWNQRQIIPAAWVQESTRSYSNTHWVYDGYGYMWWTMEAGRFKDLGMFSALGAGGHAIDVLPRAKLVVVHRVNTFESKQVEDAKRLTLLNKILDARVAKPKAHPKLEPLHVLPDLVTSHAISQELLTRYIGRYGLDDQTAVRIAMDGGVLVLQEAHNGNFGLIPLSATQFIAEDYLLPVSFELNADGSPARMVIQTAPNVKISVAFLGR